MAKIWPVYEGGRPTSGWPWADLPLADAIKLFQLEEKDLVSDLANTPRFGTTDQDLTYAGFKHIVVEVERNEGRQEKWRSGFYRSRVGPKEAFGKLLRHALATKLGSDNIVDLRWKPAVDSQGHEAIKITVVIAPDATKKLNNEAALDALVSLQDRLTEMRDDRVPILEYATEAELKQVGGP
ncbi:MAG: hypothetical protein K2Z80_17910 [Xanthobacteraceae bacterium]|nr:hypothetical protein [Xanthobacteraceae bacterium]